MRFHRSVHFDKTRQTLEDFDAGPRRIERTTKELKMVSPSSGDTVEDSQGSAALDENAPTGRTGRTISERAKLMMIYSLFFHAMRSHGHA